MGGKTKSRDLEQPSGLAARNNVSPDNNLSAELGPWQPARIIPSLNNWHESVNSHSFAFSAGAVSLPPPPSSQSSATRPHPGHHQVATQNFMAMEQPDQHAQSPQQTMASMSGVGMSSFDARMHQNPYNYAYTTDSSFPQSPTTPLDPGAMQFQFTTPGAAGSNPYAVPPPPPQTAAASTMSKSRKEVKRRTKTGCMTCRKRRIKCDEAQPVCNNCRKSRRDCLGYDPTFSRNSHNSDSGAHSPTTSSARPSSRNQHQQLLQHHQQDQNSDSASAYPAPPTGYAAASPTTYPYSSSTTSQNATTTTPGGFDFSAAIDPALQSISVNQQQQLQPSQQQQQQSSQQPQQQQSSSAGAAMYSQPGDFHVEGEPLALNFFASAPSPTHLFSSTVAAGPNFSSPSAVAAAIDASSPSAVSLFQPRLPSPEGTPFRPEVKASSSSSAAAAANANDPYYFSSSSSTALTCECMKLPAGSDELHHCLRHSYSVLGESPVEPSYTFEMFRTTNFMLALLAGSSLVLALGSGEGGGGGGGGGEGKEGGGDGGGDGEAMLIGDDGRGAGGGGGVMTAAVSARAGEDSRGASDGVGGMVEDGGSGNVDDLLVDDIVMDGVAVDGDGDGGETVWYQTVHVQPQDLEMLWESYCNSSAAMFRITFFHGFYERGDPRHALFKATASSVDGVPAHTYHHWLEDRVALTLAPVRPASLDQLLQVNGLEYPSERPLMPPSEDAMQQIHELFNYYATGLAKFLETQWLPLHGWAHLARDHGLLEKYALLLSRMEFTAERNPHENLVNLTVETHIIWDSLALVRAASDEIRQNEAASSLFTDPQLESKDPSSLVVDEDAKDASAGNEQQQKKINPPPPPAPPATTVDSTVYVDVHETALRYDILKALITNNTIDQSVVDALSQFDNSVPAHFTMFQRQVLSRERAFWRNTAKFLTLDTLSTDPAAPQQQQADAAAVDEALTAMRGLLESKENRDIMYSVAIMRVWPRRMMDRERALRDQGEENPQLDRDDLQKVDVAKNFLSQQAGGRGTTVASQRICGMVLRAWSGPGL